jgi:ABC-type branched-subunit amino acid transport system substrate-binding protein
VIFVPLCLPNFLRRMILSLVCCLVLAAGGCTGGDTRDYDEYARQGVTASEIRLGSSLPLTGHASYLGEQTLRGALSYIKYVNESGGVHGRKIVLDARDDGYDPPRCLANTQQLMIHGNVFALFGYVGTPTTMRILPLVEEARIPLLGMFTGANGLRIPFNRYVINVRASYYQETGAAVRHLVQDLGLKRIAVFYQYDAYGFDGLTGAELVLRELGLAPVARGSYIRGTNDVTDGLKRILEERPEAVVMVGTYEPCAEFIRRADAAGLKAVYYNLSFVGGEELARRLPHDLKSPVVLSLVVPPPTAPEAPRIMQVASDYVTHLKRFFPDETPNAVGLEGYINALVLVEGLRRAGPDITRETFIDAIDSLSSFSLGGTNVSFSPRNHQGMESVFFSVLRGGRFELVNDFRTVLAGGLKDGEPANKIKGAANKNESSADKDRSSANKDGKPVNAVLPPVVPPGTASPDIVIPDAVPSEAARSNEAGQGGAQ